MFSEQSSFAAATTSYISNGTTIINPLRNYSRTDNPRFNDSTHWW
jgi:hypothetical protein